MWEKLDCESVGARELEAIRTAVEARFGKGALESPAATARLLADEGAELRHAEVLELDARVRDDDSHEAAFRNVLKFATFDEAIASLYRLTNLLNKYESSNDREGVRRVFEKVREGRKRAEMIARNAKVDLRKRAEKAEIAEWFKLWLQSPKMFAAWVDVRRESEEFKRSFK